MEKINHDWFRAAIRTFVVAALVGGVSLSHADAVPASGAFDKFMDLATGAGKQTVGAGSNGTPLAVPGVPTVSTDGGSAPKVDASGSIRNPSGNRVPVNVTGRIPPAEVGKAIGRSLGRLALKLAVPITVGLELYDLSRELGFDLSRNPDGSLKHGKSDPNVCTSAPCYEWKSTNWGATAWMGKLAACSAGLSNANAANPGYFYTNPRVSASDASLLCIFDIYLASNGQLLYPDSTDTMARQGTGVSAPVYLPSSEQEFLDAIAAKSGWPSTSNLSRALVQAVESGDPKLMPGPLTVTGPATSPGTQKVTQNTTNNTTKTETTTHNHNYAGPVVTTTTTTVTNITNTTTGDTINNETSTETAPKEQDPVDECKEYPERVGCLEIDTPESEIPKETKTVTYSEENVFGDGSCPADLTATIATLGQTVKVWDWQKTCAIALPLRALVLALATFAAIMIVMPGRAV